MRDVMYLIELCKVKIAVVNLFSDLNSEVFFFKQKTAYEVRISDWSSDVCSSDLPGSKRDQGRRRAEDGAVARRTRGRGRDVPEARSARRSAREIGRASCRERVCQYV